MTRGVNFSIARFDPGIAITRLTDGVAHVLHFFLDLRVIEPPANKSLGGVESVGAVSDCLSLGRHPHQALALPGEGDDGGRGPRSLGILNHLGSLPLHNGNTGVGSPEINTNNCPLHT